MKQFNNVRSAKDMLAYGKYNGLGPFNTKPPDRLKNKRRNKYSTVHRQEPPKQDGADKKARDTPATV